MLASALEPPQPPLWLSDHNLNFILLILLFLFFLMKQHYSACLFFSIHGSVHISWMGGNRVWKEDPKLTGLVCFCSSSPLDNGDLYYSHSTSS